MGLSSTLIYISELILCSTMNGTGAYSTLASEFLQLLTRLEGPGYFRIALVLFRNPVH